MKAWFVIVLFFVTIVFSGCVTNVQETTVGSSQGNNPMQGDYSPLPENAAQENVVEEVYDAPPSIRERSVVSNPTIGQSFPLLLTAEDDKGIVELRWQSSKPFQGGQSGSFSCNMEKICSNTWNLVAMEEGEQQIIVSVVDISGKQNQASMEITVREARNMSATQASTADTASMVNETNQSSEPVPEPVMNDASCDSNSDCGYKEICTGSVCEDVECTSDSHCSGCRRCSSNSCVSCGSGPYGCYC